MNIYVGNLAHAVTEEMLRQLFEAHGEVTSVTIIKDRETGNPRGYGFIEMPNADQAQQAIEALNGYEYEGRALRVNQAHGQDGRRPQNRDRFGGGGRGRFQSRDNNGGGRPFRSSKPRF